MDQHGWNQGNYIPWNVLEAELWFGGDNFRTVKRQINGMQWWRFTDCEHPAQNANVDMDRVYGWRAIESYPHTA